MDVRAKDPLLEITIKESEGIARDKEPVTFGVPFPRGKLAEPFNFHVEDDGGKLVRTATTPLARWSDDSIKWLLFDLQVSIPAGGKKRLKFYAVESDLGGHNSNQAEANPLKVHVKDDFILVRSGDVEFDLDPVFFIPFRQIRIAGRPFLLEGVSQIVLSDEQGRQWKPRIDHWSVETRNQLRVVLFFEGSFVTGTAVHTLRYKCRVHFFAGKATARIDFTVWNPNAASHPGTVWDLGDKSSEFFRDLCIELACVTTTGKVHSYYSVDVGDIIHSGKGNVLIYQDSSGGDNWRSHNHINRHEKVPVTFRGFEVRKDREVLSRGLRATPFMAVSAEEAWLSVSVRHFWQNFPKAVSVTDGCLKTHLFPKYFADLFELQGGEQKTHSVYVCAGHGPFQNSPLDWIHEPIVPQIAPELYFDSGACPRPVPYSNVSHDTCYSAYQQLVDAAISGGRSFFARRETIDEYGWRNFGDLYADHEAVFCKGKEEFISHYNNQYDAIKGATVQFMRTGNPTWLRLADELARHVSDIDIYHTKLDRYEYNNGLFWHTDHHMDAATCTHRTTSCKHREFKDPRFVGGGPSYEHNYATGLLYRYWMTGEPRFRESVISLASYIIKGLEGPDTLSQLGFEFTKNTVKRLSQKAKRQSAAYAGVYGLNNGPGRGSGNGLNTLLDAYLLTKKNSYLQWAEILIQRCVAPDDDIDARDLLDAERRWMYVIFLQALGRYLDVKYETGQLDQSFWYARCVLLKYAQWMLENEYPYLEKPEILEFPNETWTAQDIRKSEILAHAALYAPEPLRQSLLKKSLFFFEVCINQLHNFETRDLTRPVVILMVNGMVHMDVFTRKVYPEEIASKAIDYGISGVGHPVSKNNKWGYFARLGRVVKKTSFRKEVHWVKQRLESM